MLDASSEQARSVRTPPYTSYRTFKTFIQDLREQGVPSRIDRSVLTRFSGVVGTQLMHALRFLGLIADHGRPTQRLTELVNAFAAGNWSEKLLELLRQEYAAMFAIDLETATPSHFNEAFRKAFPAADAVVQKCVTFFLYAANDAGVKISARVLKGRKPRSLTPRKKHAPRRRRRRKSRRECQNLNRSRPASRARNRQKSSSCTSTQMRWTMNSKLRSGPC